MSLIKIGTWVLIVAVAGPCCSAFAESVVMPTATPVAKGAPPAPRPFGDQAALADLILNGQDSRTARYPRATLQNIGIETDLTHVDAPRIHIASKDRSVRNLAVIITVPGATPGSTVRHLVLAEYRRTGEGDTLNEQWTYLRYDTAGTLVSVRRNSTGVAVADVAADDRPAIQKAQVAVWNSYRDRAGATVVSTSQPSGR